MPVRLHGTHVVDRLVGDWVGDDMPFLPDPARDGFPVDELEELRVVCHVLAAQHDAVGGLACVDDFGRDVLEAEHLVADKGFDAVGCEEDVAGYGVGGTATFAWESGEGGVGAERFHVAGFGGEGEGYGFFALAGFVDGARERGAVADHVGVVVGGADVRQVNVAKFLVCGAFCAICQLLSGLLSWIGSLVRLMLVSLRSTASRSISDQAPSLSSIRAMFGANWMPAPTNPNVEADSKTSMCRKPCFAKASAVARPPMPGRREYMAAVDDPVLTYQRQ